MLFVCCWAFFYGGNVKSGFLIQQADVLMAHDSFAGIEFDWLAGLRWKEVKDSFSIEIDIYGRLLNR